MAKRNSNLKKSIAFQKDVYEMDFSSAATAGCYFSSRSHRKVLVWPTEYSRWINMKTILDELVQRGHEVSVLTSTASILIDPNKPSAIKFEIYPTSLTKPDFEVNILDIFLTNARTFLGYSDCIKKLCKDMVLNKKLKTTRIKFQAFNEKKWGQFYIGVLVNVQNMTEERANVIASAIVQIPQKWVIWRFEGKKPDALGPNSQLYKQIPLNDLLDNIVHMKAGGAAVRLDLNTMSSTDLLNALKTILRECYDIIKNSP
ncbi:hypothetical protein HPG69_001466 [Diceros bicornis minor]|uniref:glucuronosyltransferase n=1 Tax=Diceros bicornis minor TaxID=77932 RepID=A0A7J7FFL3_DICBM|nr:hypothetical protein HPG69_001466 [Diceros bicornis minor]